MNTTITDETADTVRLEADTPGFSLISASATSHPDAEIAELPDTVETDESFTLNASDSTTDHGEITAYEWTINDETHIGETTDVSIAEAGTHDVSLTVTNDAGETNTTSATVTVEEQSTDTEEPGESETTDADDSEDDSTGTESLSGTAGDSPGFGLVAGLVALIVSGALLAVRVRRTE